MCKFSSYCFVGGTLWALAFAKKRGGDNFEYPEILQEKIACSVSGTGTFSDPFSYINSINQTVNAVNFGCGKITRPLS